MRQLWTLSEGWRFSLHGSVQGLGWHYEPLDGFTWGLEAFWNW